MKVKELIAKLEKLEPDLEIYGYTEDESLAKPNKPFYVFDINSVDVQVAETFRDEDRSPSITFGESKNSRKLAFINVTTDF